ncbi:MAG: histidine kinase, partial [Angelakisella sp.]
MKFIKNLSYKNKLLFFVIFFIFIPMVVFQFFYFTSTTKVIQDNAIQAAQEIMGISEYRIETIFKDVEKQSNAFRYNLTINSLMNICRAQSEQDAYLRNIDFIKQLKTVIETFRSVCLSANAIESIGLVTTTLNVHDYNFNPASFNIASDVNIAAITAALKKNQERPIWYFNKSTGHMLHVRNVSDPVTFETTGYLILAVNNHTVRSNLLDPNLKTLKSIALITPMGKWMSNSTEQLPDSLYGSGGVTLSAKKGYQTNKREDMFLCYSDRHDPGWQLVAYRPYHDMLGDNSRAQRTALGAILFILILSIIAISLLNRDFISPINELVDNMESFEKDGEYTAIAVDRTDELGYLAKAYNSMASNINFLLKKVYQEELTRKEAELKALQSQINPHFLFNTLQSINISAQMYHAEPVSDCIIALSSLLEASMGKKDPLTPLKNELDYIGNYVFIMQQRISGQLIIKKRIDEQLLQKTIPVLILQPIIENSISHANHERNICISLHIYQQDGLMHLEVCDNGGGIEPERLEQLHAMLAEGSSIASPSKRKSIGLEN